MVQADGPRIGGAPPKFLWLIFLIPALLLFFGARSAIYRYEQVAASEQTTATVYEVEHQTTSYRDSDGRTQTGDEWRYSVEFEADGEVYNRYIVEPNFDLEMVWHNSDSIDPDIYAAGARIPVLLRRDLDYAVAHDDFWAIYLTPIFLLGFGAFWLLMCLPVIYMMRDKGPEFSAERIAALKQKLRNKESDA